MSRSVSTKFAYLFLLTACFEFSSTGLLYTVRIKDLESGILEIELQLKNSPSGSVLFRWPTYEEFAPIDDVVAFDQQGRTIVVEHKEQKIGSGKKSLTLISKILSGTTGGNITVRYCTRIGKEMFARHGVETTYTFGYMDRHFALMSGRSLFLIPEGSLRFAKLRFDLPRGWKVAIPWSEREGWFQPVANRTRMLKEELVNTTLSFGNLTDRTKRIGDTLVSVVMPDSLDGEIGDEVSEVIFSIYKSVVQVFGGDGDGQYVFNFAPLGTKGTYVHPTSWSSSMGMSMSSIGSRRSIECAEQLIQRWIKFPPFRLTYDAEDYWLPDGIARYYAIKLCGKLGLVDHTRLLASERRAFVSAVADRSVADVGHVVLGNLGKEVNPPNSINDVRELYSDNSRELRDFREAVSPYIVSFVDTRLREFSQGRHSLDDVLRYEYGKSNGTRLLADIKTVLREEYANQLEPFLHNLRLIAKEHISPINVPSPWSTNKSEKAPAHRDTVRILFTGNTRGFIEHCGCKANQQGGIARRATVVDSLRNQDPDALLLDAGNLFPDGTRQLTASANAELGLYLRAMDVTGYDIASLGFNELYFGSRFLVDHIGSVKFPFLCADIYENETTLVQPYTILKKGDYTFAFIGLHDVERRRRRDEIIFQDRTGELKFVDPIAAIEEILPVVERSSDFVVIIGNMSPRLIRERLAHLTPIDLVISSNRNDGSLIETVEGLTYIKNEISGFRGRTLVLYDIASLYGVNSVEMFIDSEREIAGARIDAIPLSDEIEDHAAVRGMVDRFYLSQKVQDAKLVPLTEIESFSQADYIGAESCKTCHASQYNQWKTTKHATAWNTLLDARRAYVAKCVVCHVTGGGYDTGYQLGDLRHPLINVQCEACHGPGGNHISGDHSAIIRRPSLELCVSCHDKEHSDFVFGEYFPKVVH